jgi:hypothetical protein
MGLRERDVPFAETGGKMRGRRGVSVSGGPGDAGFMGTGVAAPQKPDSL